MSNAPLPSHLCKVSPFLILRALLETAKISLPTVVDAWRGPLDPRVANTRLSSWAKALLTQANVELDVRGVEEIQKGASYVIMSNHTSLYDIPVLFHALPLDFRMAAKSELFRVPIWGRAMRAAGFVRIDRARGAEARVELQKRARELARAQLSLWIAPEGTRSPTGALLPFKSGGFHLAAELGFPILPVRIDGTRELLGKRSLSIRSNTMVHVTIHPPIFSNNQLTNTHQLEALKTAVHAALSPEIAPPHSSPL